MIFSSFRVKPATLGNILCATFYVYEIAISNKKFMGIKSDERHREKEMLVTVLSDYIILCVSGNKTLSRTAQELCGRFRDDSCKYYFYTSTDLPRSRPVGTVAY